MNSIIETFRGVWESSGFYAITDVRQIIMLALACFLLYLGIVKKFEPLLLVGHRIRHAPDEFACHGDFPRGILVRL